MTQAELAAHRGLSLKVIKEIERGIANSIVAPLSQIGDIFGLEVAFVRKDKLRPAFMTAPAFNTIRADA